LWEAEDLLREYGQGTYILYGAGLDRRNNIRVTTLTVGDPTSAKLRSSLLARRAKPKSICKSRRAVAAAAAPFVACFRKRARDRRESSADATSAKSSDGPRTRARSDAAQ